MMDHVAHQAKDKPSDREPLGRPITSDGDDQGSYYYDDSTNYEVYRDEDDEVEQAPSSTEESAIRDV